VGPLLTADANVCPPTSDWVTMMPAMLMPRANAMVVTAVELAMAAGTVVVLMIPALGYNNMPIIQLHTHSITVLPLLLAPIPPSTLLVILVAS